MKKNIVNSELIVVESDELIQKVKAELLEEKEELPVDKLIGEHSSENTGGNDRTSRRGHNRKSS